MRRLIQWILAILLIAIFAILAARPWDTAWTERPRCGDFIEYCEQYETLR